MKEKLKSIYKKIKAINKTLNEIATPQGLTTEIIDNLDQCLYLLDISIQALEFELE